MKILWLTAFQLPWINAMVKEIIKIDYVSSINIVTVHKSNKIESHANGNIVHTLLPSKNGIFKYDRKLKNHINKIIINYKPDIIDVQGIEFFLVKSLMETSTDVPIVATIQGLTSEISKHYLAGISYFNILKNRTLRNHIFLDGIIERKLSYKKRGKNEIKILKQLDFVLGRTSWDRTYTLLHNPKLIYFHNDRNLREAFYHHNWEISEIERYSLFTTQGRYPIKGLHLLLEATAILAIMFPSLKLYIGGKDLLQMDGWYNKLAFNDYQKYILKLVKRLQLEDNVIFTGFLDENEVAERLTKTHVFVLPSVMENSPNALAEAQIIGTPAVAALVGGVGDYVKDEVTGLLYNCYEPMMLASKIKSIFMDDQLAAKLSQNEIHVARSRHDIHRNTSDLLQTYLSIIKLKSQSKSYSG